jgi:hypothetical protein
MKPFLGGSEDFNIPQSCASEFHGTMVGTSSGILDELIYHWTIGHPPMFEHENPSLASLSYYPLKIVAAEWVNYIAVMAFSIREHERSPKLSADLVNELEKLNTDVRLLQAWSRRALSTQVKMRQVLRFISLHEDQNNPCGAWTAIREDYEFISVEVANHASRLESMIPITMSFVQLIESRRSLAETENVARLTVLALVFVPLSYVATLFSMSDNFRPGGELFWVYFVVAVPLTLTAILVAKVPLISARCFFDRLKKDMIKRKEKRSLREDC